MTHLIEPSAWLAILADATIKGMAVLAAAWLATLALHRASSSARHAAWALAVVALIALPILSAASPDRSWSRERRGRPMASESAVPGPPEVVPDVAPGPGYPARPAASPAPAASIPIDLARIEAPSARPAPAVDGGPGRAGWLALAWAFGFAAVLGPWLVGMATACGRGLRAPRVTAGPWSEAADAIRRAYGIRRRVALRVGPEGSMPSTWGFVRPSVLLPVDAEGWSPEALRAVLLHELAHARRGDFLTQGLSRLACALYWFNPLVWLADGRLRAESERASDDLALAAGPRPSDYASDLVRVVRSLRARAVPGAVAMARPGSLEGRIRAILEPGRDRRPVSRRRVAMMGLAALALMVPMGTLRLVPRAEARQDPAPRPAPVVVPDPKPAGKPETPWRKALPGGVTVELLGVGPYPEEPGGRPKGWWSPDGSPSAEIPPGRSNHSFGTREGEIARLFAARVTDVKDAYYYWKTLPGGSGGGQGGGGAPEAAPGRVQWFPGRFPDTLAACTVRFGVASGPWKTEAEADGRSSTSTQRDGHTVLFTRAREAAGRVTIVVTDTIASEDQFRVAAIDRDGRAHTPVESTGVWDGKLRQHDQVFELPIDRIERFELQSRPIAWVEFPDVALKPKPGAPTAPRPAPAPRDDVPPAGNRDRPARKAG